MYNSGEKYFLGANSAEGFFSVFRESYNAKKGWRAYIIKGGPGTGKSSFMKNLVKKAQEKNIDTIPCYCSSDPQSLDGVIFPEKCRLILDGTAPHIVEPEFPGVCEQILNFGEFWDVSKLTEKRDEIISASRQNKAFHLTASRYLRAAGQLMLDNLKTAEAAANKEKAAAFAERLCENYIPQSAGEPHEWVRFIEGITPKGIISFPEAITAAADTVIPISDLYGSVSGIITERVRSYALNAGYEIITLKNPYLPSSLIDHIIIPELSLAIVTENKNLHFETVNRRIHARRFEDQTRLKAARQRISSNKRVINELLSGAISALSDAKISHDRLEEFYIKAMDFEKLNAFSENFSEIIFG